MSSIDKKSYEMLFDPLWDTSQSGTRLDLDFIHAQSVNDQKLKIKT